MNYLSGFSLFFFIAISVASTNIAFSAETPKQAQQITIDEGLSQSTVSSVIQAPDGRMWFATGDGISIYDGENFQYIYRGESTEQGLQSNYTKKVSIDAEGRIWVGTLGGGISVFDQTGKFLLGFSAPDTRPSLNDIYDFAWTEDGKIWVATEDGTLVLSPSNSWWEEAKIQKLPLPIYPKATRAIETLYKSQILIGSKNEGLVVFNTDTGKHQSHSIENSNLTGNQVIDLFRDSNGGIWIGTEDGGLNFLDAQSGIISQPITLPDNDVESIAQDILGRLWFGTWSNGIFVYDPSSGKTENYRAHQRLKQRLSSNTVVALQKDQTGRMWAGTYDGGVNSLSETPDSFTTIYDVPTTGTAGPVSGIVWALEEATNHDLWVGTKIGLGHYSIAEKRYDAIDLGEGAADVRAILQLENSVLIGVKGRGLVEYFPQSKRQKVVTDRLGNNIFEKSFVRLLMRAKDQTIWVGTHSGLFHLNGKLELLRHYENKEGKGGLPHDRIRSLYQSANGTIWIGTSGGLSRLDPATGELKSYFGPQYFQDNDVKAIWQRQDGTLYVGTQSGISIFDPEMNNIKNIQRSDGLPNETIYSLLPDRAGNLWVTTNNGLVKFNPDNEQIKVYRTRDGLQGAEFNFNAHTILSDGSIAVGGINGFSLFNPEKLKTNPFPPLVSLDSSKSSFPLVSPAEIVMDFIVAHYSQPAENALYWKLEPVDKEWKISKGSNHHIVKENLATGEYKLLYKGVAASGNSSDVGTFTFHIEAPVYQRWYAILAYLFCLAGIGYALVQLRTQTLKWRNAELQTLVEEKTHELTRANETLATAYREKSNFYSLTAHEIRTPISLIMAPLQSIESSPSLNNKDRAMLSLVKRAVERLKRLTDEMAYVAEPVQQMAIDERTVDLEAFIEPIIEYYNESARIKGVFFNCSMDCQTAATTNVKALDLILHNLLSNALKFTEPGKEIRVEIAIEHNCISVLVGNESELPKAAIANLTQQNTNDDAPVKDGSKIIASMVQQAKGTITVQAKPASVTIRLPIRHHTKSVITAEKLSPANQNRNILVVEDDPDLRKYLATSLEELGNVTTAASCHAARSALERKSYQLIICDVMLPDKNGFDFVKEVKEDLETSHIPAIFLTALADASSHQKGLNAWGDDYITKPFDLEELKAKVNVRLRNIAAVQANTRRQNRKTASAMKGEESPLTPVDRRLVEQIENVIFENISNQDFNIEKMAIQAAISKRSLQRKLNALYGLSFSELLGKRRIELAEELLRRQISVKETCHQCGYLHPSSFTRKFKAQTGMLPSEYRDRHSRKGLSSRAK